MPLTRNNGFTLVELAVALLVIGLLIAGVLKGMELVENAKIVATIHQMQQYQAAVMTFKKRFRAAPGDISNPGDAIPGCNTAPCNVSGDNNRKLTGEFERGNFWLHLAKAGMISGVDTNAANRSESQPESHFGGDLMVNYLEMPADGTWRNFSGNTLHFVRSDDVTGLLETRHAENLDRKVDDGLPRTGDMRSLNGADICVDETGNQYYLQANPDGEAGDETHCVFIVKFRL